MVEALSAARLPEAQVDPSEHAMLRVVEKITRTPSHVNAHDMHSLREYGWTDPQIAEMVYITALFAFFNRIADAFGLQGHEH